MRLRVEAERFPRWDTTKRVACSGDSWGKGKTAWSNSRTLAKDRLGAAGTCN